MLEIARVLERMTANLNPVVLVGLGLAAVIVGLFVWLGGLGFRKLLVAIIGAVGGGSCAFLMHGRDIMPIAVAAAIGVVAAIIFERLFITIMTAALAALFGFAILAGLYDTDFSEGLKRACLQMPLYTWVVIAALVVVFIIAGFYLWRLTSALCCAALGTMLVFAGMIMLLLYKNAEPVTAISRSPAFYAAVFLAMIVFGTLEQLLLCKPPNGQPRAKEEKGTDEKESARIALGWRNR